MAGASQGKPASADRQTRWQTNRAAHLAALPWLRTDTSGGHPVRYVADELLVRDAHHGVARDILTGLGHTGKAVTQDEPVPGFQRLRTHGLDVARAAQGVRHLVGNSNAASPNHVFLSSPYEHGGPFGPPALPTGAYALPAGPLESASVRITVVDTGIWTDSPLPAAWYEATSADYDNTTDPDSDVGHANFIAGVIMSGTRNAKVRIVKVLDAAGVCTEVDLANAILALGATDIINLSLGGYTEGDQPPAALADALGTVLGGTDRVVVAAAGNDGLNQAYWPAAFTTAEVPWADQVVAVAAHDGSNVCSWSNTGPWVSLAAPGSDITSTYVTQWEFTAGWAQWSGTSFAAPYVAAAIAERRGTAGSIAAAVKELRHDAAAHKFSNYPGLS